jgi:hypothetical protein
MRLYRPGMTGVHRGFVIFFEGKSLVLLNWQISPDPWVAISIILIYYFG